MKIPKHLAAPAGLIALCTALLGACSSTPVATPAPTPKPLAAVAPAAQPSPQTAAPRPTAASTVATVTLPAYLDPKSPIASDRSVYFDFDMTVVKSPLSQPRFFEDGAERLINVDAPGATSANVRGLGHTRCHRPLFPLDAIEDYHPRARVFRRQA